LSQKALTRRGFLIAAGAVVAASALRPRPTGAQTPPAPIPGKEKLIVRSPRPVNLETPLRELTAYHTPDDVFFVRNNYDTAPIDPAQWSVKIEGEVDNPLVLRLDGGFYMTSNYTARAPRTTRTSPRSSRSR